MKLIFFKEIFCLFFCFSIFILTNPAFVYGAKTTNIVSGSICANSQIEDQDGCPLGVTGYSGNYRIRARVENYGDSLVDYDQLYYADGSGTRFAPYVHMAVFYTFYDLLPDTYIDINTTQTIAFCDRLNIYLWDGTGGFGEDGDQISLCAGVATATPTPTNTPAAIPTPTPTRTPTPTPTTSGGVPTFTPTPTTSGGGGGSDIELTLEGFFYSPTVFLRRNLADNRFNPAELFIFRPDFMINAPLELLEMQTNWQEINPRW